jgi:purine-binding chemotaxis protein CheW
MTKMELHGDQSSASLTRENDAPALAVAETRVLFVAFKSDGAELALPANTVVQMESFTGATPVPGALPYVKGIVQIRGRVVPVIDLRVRFGGPPTVITEMTRLVVGRHGERTVALLVDTAREVVMLAPSSIKPAPRIVDGQAAGFVRGIAQTADRVLMILDFAKVIGEAELDVE